ncbi:MAG: ligase-associated DNA damage response DEXH box helicase [Chitinophagales bacterium]|nr:ligase-associated DNA damage response DEXH box helicase [Chitinophagales bacterium]
MSALQKVEDWFHQKGWKPFPFQYEVWEKYAAGYSGLLNAPTGSGKTFALWMPAIMEYMQNESRPKGLQLLWITPLKALAKDIHLAVQEATKELGVSWKVELRTGDVSAARKKKQLEKLPHALITTPESLHLLLTMGESGKLFSGLQVIIADEWHELFGSKRGVLVELALSRIKSIRPALRIWGISATIGNLQQSMEVLLGNSSGGRQCKVVAENRKRINIKSVIPGEIERLPWAGHLGIRLLPEILDIINKSRSTLLFTNTRGQAEIWYQQLLNYAPELAGTMAIHHGSLSKEVRAWVENALHNDRLKVVVCTSSLDLGVDFTPVETVIQVGSPKGVARFLQRAGRSGHQPDAESNIYFVPTHSLELIEGAALKEAVEKNMVEDRIPYIKPYDVLIQYLVTLATGDGFRQEEIFSEIKTTFAFADVTEDEWDWMLQFITTGGSSLENYREFSKVVEADGIFKVYDKKVALRHRLSVGTIVSDTSMSIRYLTGGNIGTIEEYFISRLNPGDVFWFAGKCLSLVQVRGSTAYVRKVKATKGQIPSWQGGRMPLSSQLSAMIRKKISEAKNHTEQEIEVRVLKSLLDLQEERSLLPSLTEFLLEKLETDEGYHCFFFPFEGRLVHEGMAALFAYRIALLKPISFSIAMNDYGFELLSDEPIPLEEAIAQDLFSTDNLLAYMQASVNATEMAMRRFREVARIAGLIFSGFPGRQEKERHLQSSTSLLFKVFSEYDPKNLLLRQCYQEVMDFQLEEVRLRSALQRIHSQKAVIRYTAKPTPFAFPIMVDRMREKLSSEKLEARVRKMQLYFESETKPKPKPSRSTAALRRQS